tara:strand:+ start:5091 stop:5459 length:369 start_codon:yes stop_codon:yes gene_type:complete
MKYTVVGISHWHAKGEEWGDHYALHRQGCPEAKKNFYNVEYTVDVDTIEEAVIFCFGDFINDYEDGMTVEEAGRYLKRCACTEEGANFCNVSKCKHCDKQIYDLENAIWTEWYSDDDCGCNR